MTNEPMNAAARFFYVNAGYSYNAATETAEQGRERCARNLAAAESIAREAGVSFDWRVDHDCDSEHGLHPLYECLAYDCAGKVVASLHAIDFGADGSPHSSDYRRVVEAELADEFVTRTIEAAE